MMALKQQYLHANAPLPPPFLSERVAHFQTLLRLLTPNPTRWLPAGFNPTPLIETYKQAYGLTSSQLETLLTLLLNIALQEEGLSTETRVVIMRLINSLTEYQIHITDNFRLNNGRLLALLRKLAKQGLRGTLRSADAVVEELCKLVLYFSRFGEEIVEEALRTAVEMADLRYVLLFLRSIRTTSAAQVVVR